MIFIKTEVKKCFLFFLFVLLLIIPAENVHATGWLAGWSHRKLITISNTNVVSDLSYFPLMVQTASDTDIGGGVSDTTNGYDIRFTDADGTTILPYEKEKFSVVGGISAFIFWVRVPTIYSAPTGTQNTIYIYYGNSSANTDWTAAQSSIANCTSITNAQCVWKEGASQNNAGIWHLKEATGANNADSTSNGNTGTPKATTTQPAQTDGKIGGSLRFDGNSPNNQNVEILDNSSLTLTNTLTVDMWANFTSVSASGGVSLLNKYPGVLTLWLYSGDLYFDMNNGSPPRVFGRPAGGFLTGTWYHIVGTFTKNGGANGMNLYINNVRVKTGDPGSSTPGTTLNNFRIGYSTNFAGDEEMYGTIDEVRVANVARSADWIKFEFNNDSSATNEIIIAPTGETTDTTAPTTSASGGVYSFGNWTTSPVTVSLACADGIGTGCATGYPKYCVDASNTCDPTTSGTIYSAPLAVSTEGISYIRYYSVDNNSNAETIKSSTVKIDVTAPTTSDNFSNSGIWENSAQTITLTPADSVSGLAWTKYCTGSTDTCDPSTGTSYTDPVVISTEGTSYFRYASQDNAGNTQTTVSKIVMIDTSSQVTQVSISPIADSTVPNVSADVTITNEGHFDYEYQYKWCVVSDASSPCDSSAIYYSSESKRINAGKSYDKTLTATVSTAGQYYFKVITIYNINQSSDAFRQFTISDVAPTTFTLIYTAGANGSITGTNPQTVSSGSDGSSVTAVPSTGYHFSSWSDSLTNNPRTDTNILSNLNVTANFSANSVSVGGGGGGFYSVPIVATTNQQTGSGFSLTSAQMSSIINLLKSFGVEDLVIDNVRNLLNVTTPKFSKYVFLRYLGYGDKGEDVLVLQKMLVELGFLSATPTGHYGPATIAAVKKIQQAHQLKQLGIVGPATRDLLNEIQSK